MPFFALSILFLAILSACAGAPATEVPAAPEAPAAPEEPTQPAEPSEGLPVQYGQDSRTELFQFPDSKLKEMAGSVAVFVHKRQVNVSGNAVTLDGYTLNEMSEMGWLVSGFRGPMCAEELFASQMAPGFCTGFLVGEDVLVTAGHCLTKAPCSDTSIVFGFQMESDGSLASLTRDNVFECAEVIVRVDPSQENQYLDFAIIKLDRPTGRPGLIYATEDHLKAQDAVAVLGYPSGLPQKIAADAHVMSNDVNNPFFVTNLDTFGSNSGSPVINTVTYQVEGILVRGMTDYVLADDDTCVRVNRCPESGGANCTGENATKMALLAGSFPENKSEAPNGLSCYPNLVLILSLATILRRKTR